MFGASLAFVFSLLGDPIRRSVAKRRMRNELYRDLAYSRLSLNRAVAHWNQELTVKERNDSFFNSVGSYTETFTDLMLDSLKEIHLAVYDNYYQNHLEMFVSLREHREIREIYAKLR